MNTVFDKKVLYLSMCCSALRFLIPFAKSESFTIYLIASTQLFIGLFFIYLIYREYRKDVNYEKKFYIMYLMAAWIILIIVNQLRVFTMSHLPTDFSIGGVLGIDSIFKVVWVLLNAFLFQRFKLASYEKVAEGISKKKKKKKKK